MSLRQGKIFLERGGHTLFRGEKGGLVVAKRVKSRENRKLTANEWVIIATLPGLWKDQVSFIVTQPKSTISMPRVSVQDLKPKVVDFTLGRSSSVNHKQPAQNSASIERKKKGARPLGKNLLKC